MLDRISSSSSTVQPRAIENDDVFTLRPKSIQTQSEALKEQRNETFWSTFVATERKHWSSVATKIITSPHPIRVQDRHCFQILLAAQSFRLCWWTVCTIHATCIAFLVAMCWVYFWILTDPVLQDNLLSNLSFSFSLQTLRSLVYCFALVAVLHAFVLVGNVFASLRARRLVFWFGSTSTKKASSVSCSKTQHRSKSLWSIAIMSDEPLPFNVLLKKLVSFWKKQWIEPFFYIHGNYFETYFLIHEYVEVISQLYQAYFMSFFIANQWINCVYVAMMVLNSFATPLIQKLVPDVRLTARRRFLSVILSACLNMVTSIAIPVAVFSPYVKEYNTTIKYFPDELLFNEVWYVNAVHENQQLFVTSYLDFIATWAPHWGIFSSLMICENLVTRRAHQDPKRVVPSSRGSGRKKDSTVRVATSPDFRASPRVQMVQTLISNAREDDIKNGVGPRMTTNGSWPGHSELGHPPLRLTSVSIAATPHIAQARSFMVRLAFVLARNLLWVLGVSVLLVFLSSRVAIKSSSCMLHSRPWFNSRSSCVVLNINCFRSGIHGSEHEIHQLLDEINRATLFTLLLSHCPALEIPPILREFHFLGGIGIYNSSVSQWSAQASIREQDHPTINFVYIARSNLSSGVLPQGLLDPEMPKTLVDIMVFEANLSSLPTNLHELWTALDHWCFEFCQLHELPNTIAQMMAPKLVLTGNPLPALLFVNGSLLEQLTLQKLWLSSTPVAFLPPQQDRFLASMEELRVLQLEHTQLHRIPEYIRDWYLSALDDGLNAHHSLVGTPYCLHKQLTTEDQQPMETDPAEASYREQVCRNDSSTWATFFPIDIVNSNYRLG